MLPTSAVGMLHTAHLAFSPLLDRTQVVPQVEVSRGLNARHRSLLDGGLQRSFLSRHARWAFLRRARRCSPYLRRHASQALKRHNVGKNQCEWSSKCTETRHMSVLLVLSIDTTVLIILDSLHKEYLLVCRNDKRACPHVLSKALAHVV